MALAVREARVDADVILNYSKSKVEEKIATLSARLQGKMTGGGLGQALVRAKNFQMACSNIFKNSGFSCIRAAQPGCRKA